MKLIMKLTGNKNYPKYIVEMEVNKDKSMSIIHGNDTYSNYDYLCPEQVIRLKEFLSKEVSK